MKYIPAIILSCLCPLPAQAQSLTDGNLPADFYPHPTCVKPDKNALGASPGAQDQQAMLAYNLKVKIFNTKAGTFNVCLKRYIDNAQRDIDVIQAQVHAAVTDANSP
jgi:hypothetical protein